MSVPQQASPTEVVGVGITFAAAGVYFILVGLGTLPAPSATASPPFIIVAAGLAFLFAGLMAIVRAKAHAGASDSELPPDAPRWTKVSYRVTAIAAAGSLAAIGTFIAIGSGPRPFTFNGATVPVGETIGRTVFALGAVIAWIYVIALTVSTVRKLFDRRESR